MRKILFGSLIVTAFVLMVVFTQRTHSQSSSSGDVALDAMDRSFASSGEVTSISSVKQIIRPDGSRSIKKLRTFRSSDSPTGWETHEGWSFYDAKTNVTKESFPALSMHGDLPIGNQHYKSLAPVATCVSFLPPGVPVHQRSSGSHFGHNTEVYKFEMGTDRVWLMEIEMFPEYGCLIGNKTTEVRRRADNGVMARRTIELLALRIVPDDPSEFAGPPATFKEATPSEILKKHADMMGTECTQCVLDTGSRADQRHQKMWAERTAGKR